MKELIQLVPQEIDRIKKRIPGMKVGDYLYCTSRTNFFKGCIMKVYHIDKKHNRYLKVFLQINSKKKFAKVSVMELSGTQSAIDKVGYRITKEQNAEYFL